MNLTASRSWPHPVLSPLNDDIAPNAFDFDLTVSIEHPNWQLEVDVQHGDQTLNKFIEKRKALYLLQLECRRTYYRAGFTSFEPQFELSILGNQLCGAVDASLMIVVSSEIDAYRHPQQHPDYGDANFDLGIGEPLAVAITKRFDAYIEADPILKLSSIFDIKRDDESRLVRVNCDGQRILVKLPSDNYDDYVKLRASDDVRNLVASTVLLPALLHSFHRLGRIQDPEEFDTFKSDHRWARCVLPRLDAMGVKINPGSDIDGEKCLEAAQRLLHGPLGRCLGELEQMLDTGGRG